MGLEYIIALSNISGLKKENIIIPLKRNKIIKEK